MGGLLVPVVAVLYIDGSSQGGRSTEHKGGCYSRCKVMLLQPNQVGPICGCGHVALRTVTSWGFDLAWV